MHLQCIACARANPLDSHSCVWLQLVRGSPSRRRVKRSLPLAFLPRHDGNAVRRLTTVSAFFYECVRPGCFPDVVRAACDGASGTLCIVGSCGSRWSDTVTFQAGHASELGQGASGVSGSGTLLGGATWRVGRDGMRPLLESRPPAGRSRSCSTHTLHACARSPAYARCRACGLLVLCKQCTPLCTPSPHILAGDVQGRGEGGAGQLWRGEGGAGQLWRGELGTHGKPNPTEGAGTGRGYSFGATLEQTSSGAGTGSRETRVHMCHVTRVRTPLCDGLGARREKLFSREGCAYV